MAESTRIPYLLESYLQLPPETSLIVLSGTLNATTNWLLLRYLLLTGKRSSPNASSNVVFVSFLRDWDFWRDGTRRLGLDLNQAVKSGRLIYIDGLSKLFSSGHSTGSRDAAQTQFTTITDNHITSIEASISKSLLSAAADFKTKPLLIIDGLDFLLASTQTTANEVLGSLLVWQEAAYATILAVSADAPLIHTQQTPLEIDHAAFVTSLIHQANLVMSLRLLTTGAAKDVSGVLRVSRGGAVGDFADAVEIEEKEVLYLVGGDGNVKVFERGSG